MIQKDIVLEEKNETQHLQCKSESTTDVDEIDAIFAIADQQIADHKNKTSRQKEKKKKKKHPILRCILVFVLTIVLVVVLSIYAVVDSVKKTYPVIKQELLQQISTMQEDLMKVDDSTLSVDEYYQKKILLLFSADEIEAALEGAEDLKNLQKILDAVSDVDLTLLPEEKVKEYEKLIAEYELASRETDNQKK